MPSPQQLDREALGGSAAAPGRLGEDRPPREVRRSTLIRPDERDEYDVTRTHVEPCFHAAEAYPGPFERSMPPTDAFR